MSIFTLLKLIIGIQPAGERTRSTSSLLIPEIPFVDLLLLFSSNEMKPSPCTRFHGKSGVTVCATGWQGWCNGSGGGLFMFVRFTHPLPLSNPTRLVVRSKLFLHENCPRGPLRIHMYIIILMVARTHCHPASQQRIPNLLPHPHVCVLCILFRSH